MNHTYQVIAESIDYLVCHYQQQPDLAFLARRAGYESTHFQKLFKNHVGISPKRLIQYMSMRHARELLAGGASTYEAASEAGLSGTGRLYDLFVTCQAVTPGQARYRGRNVEVSYGFYPVEIGELLIAQTDFGVCFLGFLIDQKRNIPVARMKQYLPEANYHHDQAAISDTAEKIAAIWRGNADSESKLSLDLHGTNLQIAVWQALLKIPSGRTATYSDIARQVGKPKAARAIGNAVGANPVSLLIPCHRVIRATGIIDNYGWGSARKKLLLGLEQDLKA